MHACSDWAPQPIECSIFSRRPAGESMKTSAFRRFLPLLALLLCASTLIVHAESNTPQTPAAPATAASPAPATAAAPAPAAPTSAAPGAADAPEKADWDSDADHAG